MKLKNLRLFGRRGIRSFSFWLTLGALVMDIVFLWNFTVWDYSSSKVGMNAWALMILTNPLLLMLFLLGVVFQYGPFPEIASFVMGGSFYFMSAFHLLTMYAYGRLLDWRVFRKRPYQ